MDQAAGGSNDEDNGIPVCFDCHQEIGSYNNKHPRGNKIRPDELQARRDRVYSLVDQEKLDILAPTNLQRLFGRQLWRKTTRSCISNPSVAELLITIDKLDFRDWNDAFLILSSTDADLLASSEHQETVEKPRCFGFPNSRGRLARSMRCAKSGKLAQPGEPAANEKGQPSAPGGASIS